MLRSITKCLRFGVGADTTYISSLMKKFKPQSQGDIIKILNNILQKKEYAEISSQTQAFVNKIQYYILKKPGIITAQSFYIYQLLKQLNFLTSRLKYGLLRNLLAQLESLNQRQLQLKNNQLEVILWFIYRQYIYLRESTFFDLASNYTLKLFEIHEYMNSLKILPAWQPYLRISVLLQALGHEVQIRKDFSFAILQSLDFRYFPFLNSLFREPMSRVEFREKYGITEPLFIHICNLYISRDKQQYDEYLQHIEKIDNMETGQEIQYVLDPLPWQSFVQIFQFYAKAFQTTQLDTNLSYQIHQLFWRICETKNMNVQQGVKILQIISENQHIMDNNITTIISRIMEALQEFDYNEYRYVNGKAFYYGIASIKNTFRIPKETKQEFMKSIIRKIPESILWTHDEKQQVLKLLTENKIDFSEEVKEFLTRQNKSQFLV